MKVGDKVLCKKDFRLLQNDEILFHKDCFYKITRIFVTSNYGVTFQNVVSKDSQERYFIEISSFHYFSLYRVDSSNVTSSCFFDYFYSTKEIRKNNLLKINELCKSTKYESR
jgi:hypothetical protein